VKPISISSVIILLLVSIAAFAQEPEELFANVYIDRGLPAPLSLPAVDKQPLPSDRLSELTVTVAIVVFSFLRRSVRKSAEADAPPLNP
jgi:hypothetical protein